MAKCLVLKLSKAIYGLNQSPREWTETLDKFLRLEFKMARLKTEQCIYVRFNEDRSEYIILSTANGMQNKADDIAVFAMIFGIKFSENKTFLRGAMNSPSDGNDPSTMTIRVQPSKYLTGENANGVYGHCDQED